jgi:cellulose synthase/poly-beta-1,6-N-acetylglucosamine synthase-like glycosyltransferase
VLLILLFPVIYNNIALLTNYLDMTILAGPSLPYTDYGLQINLVWGKLLSWAQGGGIWGMLVSPITSVAGWIVALIVYLMTIFLGVIRIWLVTVMVIGFPISLALKQIPFAKKLSSMVEDTLYGLMLASLMSSVAIGVAAYILADAPGGPVWSATIFAGTGINGISN